MGGEEAGKRTMYRAERFSPSACPNCGRQFRQQNDDWMIYMGSIVDGQKVPDPEWPRIMCAGCEALVKIRRLEEYQVSDKAIALRLIAEQGFCNLIEVEAVGNMAVDFHVDYSKGESRLEVIDCEDEQGGDGCVGQ